MTKESKQKKKILPDDKHRIVMTLSKHKMEDIAILADLYGKPQYVIMERAFAEYLRQNKKAIDNFKEIRKKLRENYDVETARLKKFEEEYGEELTNEND